MLEAFLANLYTLEYCATSPLSSTPAGRQGDAQVAMDDQEAMLEASRDPHTMEPGTVSLKGLAFKLELSPASSPIGQEA